MAVLSLTSACVCSLPPWRAGRVELCCVGLSLWCHFLWFDGYRASRMRCLLADSSAWDVSCNYNGHSYVCIHTRTYVFKHTHKYSYSEAAQGSFTKCIIFLLLVCRGFTFFFFSNQSKEPEGLVLNLNFLGKNLIFPFSRKHRFKPRDFSVWKNKQSFLFVFPFLTCYSQILYLLGENWESEMFLFFAQHFL